MSITFKIKKTTQPGVKGGGEASYSGAIESKGTITEKEFVQMYMKKIRMSEGQVETHGRASLPKNHPFGVLMYLSCIYFRNS